MSTMRYGPFQVVFADLPWISLGFNRSDPFWALSLCGAGSFGGTPQPNKDSNRQLDGFLAEEEDADFREAIEAGARLSASKAPKERSAVGLEACWWV